MYGRYSLHTHPEVSALHFKLGLMPDIAPRYNIGPRTKVLIVRNDPEMGRIADLYRWGLIPGWAKDLAIGNKLANVRGEPVAEKPSFRSAFKRERPAGGGELTKALQDRIERVGCQ